MTFCFTTAQAQDPCEKARVEAKKMYDLGRFEEAGKLLKKCLESTDPFANKLPVYRIAALNYIATDYIEKAKSEIGKILDASPDYTPEPIRDPKRFIKLVNEEKQRRAKPPILAGRRKWWVWLSGGSLLTAGVVAAIISSGEEVQGPRPLLPEPPLPDEGK